MDKGKEIRRRRVSIMRFAYSQVENLNEAEMCVYNYVVKNLKHILNLSVRELADEVHVSTATVMRFCKKMGYSGFSELKYKIKEFYEQQDQEDNYEKLLFCKWVVIFRLFTMFRAHCISISHSFWRQNCHFYKF